MMTLIRLLFINDLKKVLRIDLIGDSFMTELREIKVDGDEGVAALAVSGRFVPTSERGEVGAKHQFGARTIGTLQLDHLHTF